MLPAIPRPVVRPIRALISWTTDINGYVNSIAKLRPGSAVGCDAARIVVRGAGDQAGAGNFEQARLGWTNNGATSLRF